MSNPSASWTLLSDESAAASTASTSVTVEPGVDLELDDTGDLVVDTDLHLTTGLAAVKQGAQIRCRLFRGELFFNQDKGIPYLARAGVVTREESLLGGKYDELRTRAAFREAVEDTPGVASVALTTSFSGTTRRLSVRWRAVTDLGEVSGTTEVG